MESCKRVILHFDCPVYNGECNCWYLLNYNTFPTISLLLDDLTQKLKLATPAKSIYLNDVIVPHWESPRIIAFDTDNIKVLTNVTYHTGFVSDVISIDNFKNTKIPLHEYNEVKNNITTNIEVTSSEVQTKMHTADIESVAKEVIPIKQIKSVASDHAPNKDNIVKTKDTTNLKGVVKDEKVQIVNDETVQSNISGTVADDEMEVDGSTVINTSNPYLNNSSLKINNNFKKKFLNTTPTHKDRYTNRSKVYISPISRKNTAEVTPLTSSPVLSALQTAVMETTGNKQLAGNQQNGTINNVSLPTMSLSLSNDKGMPEKGNMPNISLSLSECSNKATVFSNRVASIIDKKLKRKLSSGESSTSSESEEETSKPPSSKCVKANPNNPKKNAKPSCFTDSSSSSSDEETTKPKVTQQPTSIPKKKSKSSSSDSTSSSDEEEASKPPAKCTKPNAANKSSSSSDFPPKPQSKIIKPAEKPPNPKTKPVPSSSSDSDESSVDQSESGKIVKNPVPSSTEESESEESESDDGEIKPPKMKIHKSRKKESSASESEENAAKSPDTSTAKVPIDYSTLQGLQGTPRVADKLAFKMLDLNESYCPVVSDYKEGVITEYDTASQQVKVKLLRPISKPATGRFELEGMGHVIDVIELNVKQLIEPKLLPA